MELYVRFMGTLTIGLIGFGFLMTTLFETLLLEWDPAHDIRRWWRRMSASRSHASAISAEDILLQLQTQRAGIGAAPRYSTIDRRRDALRAVSDAEQRLGLAARS
jgi:hypothetical protein